MIPTKQKSRSVAHRTAMRERKLTQKLHDYYTKLQRKMSSI